MPTNALQELGLTPDDATALSPRLRDRLVSFLLRWQRHEALDACLNELLADRPLQSLLDARAQMLLEQGLLEQGLLDAAWETMQQRHERSASIPSRILAARIRLAQGDVQDALSTAQALVRESQESSMAWGFLGEVRLAGGDHAEALAAYRRMSDLAPDSRSYLLGVMAVYQARGDWVTASAYAVRLQESATPDSPLLVPYLRRLRQYFQASHEPNRVADIDAELATRYADELADLAEALASDLGRMDIPRREATPPVPEPLPKIEQAPPQALDSFESVSVSAQERARIQDAVRRLFGFESLLPGQAEIMACSLRGENVLAVLPTGGGKSLCYQLPALLAEKGATFVISPLIALMKDQVDKLPNKARRLATTINSSLESDELHRRLDDVRAGRYRLVYAAPERLRQPPFLHALRQAGVNRLVIDEVHCVSMWGHDFRPDYLSIGEARQALGNPPLLAMTATAAPRVRLDILQRLGTMRVIAGDVLRSNLRLEVMHARSQDDKLRYLLSFCRNEPGAGIIYGDTRQRCEELAELLRSQGVSANHYHAGIENRAQVQDEFMSSRTRVIVATVAFGMGIDKPDIRFIVHFAPPPSLEAYYQEAGRAGRDGLPARCVLMYANSDRATLTRRSHRDELSEDFLRRLYAAVKHNLDGAHVGRVVIDDLRRDLQAEDTPVRVGISVLEQVHLLKRWQDMPHTLTLRLTRAVPPDQPELATLCQAAHLQIGQTVTRDPLDMAQQAGLDARSVEQRLLAWAEAGYLECRAATRDPLLELLPAPKDTRERLRTLLEQYEKVQSQRVAEIVSYARTRRCRHGHISAYFGGRDIQKCSSCDNCLGSVAEPGQSGLPDEASQLQTILQTAARGWGPHNLILILRGQADAPPSARGGMTFGALAFRSEGALGRMIAALVGAGLLQQRRLQHGGVMFELTPSGRGALGDPSLMSALLARPAAGPAVTRDRRIQEKRAPYESATSEDQDLFERLSAWRLEKAQELGLRPFLVAHNSLLHAIAAARPQTESELRTVKGMGPAKMAKYGAELLSLVQEVLKEHVGPV